MKVGQSVVYFFPASEKDKNNYSQIAPALVNRVWGQGGNPSDTLNLTVIPDNSPVQSRSSVLRATSLKQAAEGSRWASHEDCESWGLDLSQGYEDTKLEAALASAASPDQSQTGGDQPADESKAVQD